MLVIWVLLALALASPAWAQLTVDPVPNQFMAPPVTTGPPPVVPIGTVTATFSPPRPPPPTPECAVTLTLPKGDVPVPDDVDVVVTHATAGDGSVSARHCKISVRR